MKLKSSATSSSPKPKSKWGLVLKIIITVASAIAGALGISACSH